MPLQHLDFVAVRIFDEEKARDQFAVILELNDLARFEPFGFEAAMLLVQILDNEGDVAVAIAKVVGLVRSLLIVSSTSYGVSAFER